MSWRVGCLELARRLVVVSVILFGCVACGESMNDGDMSTSESVNDRPSERRRGKGDYFGSDDRLDPYQAGVTDRQREWARATALITKASKIVESDQTEGLEIRAETYGERLGICEDERFVDQTSGGFCTAFLVAPSVLVTAGHCLPMVDTPCENGRFVFDYGYYEQDDDPTRVARDDVYRCEEIVSHTLEGDDPDELDLAVIRLRRPVDDRQPLSVRQSGTVEPGTPLATIGYPAGLPVKVAAGGVVVDREGVRMVSTSDAFGGNSGGPVINLQTGEVEGLVSSEQGDRYVDDEEDECQRPKKCTETGDEQCTGMSSVVAEYWRDDIEEAAGSSDQNRDAGGDGDP